MDYEVIVCPHCASTAKYYVNLGPNSNGRSSPRCKSCNKDFHIQYEKGKICKVDK